MGTKIPFKYYLHDDSFYEYADEIFDDLEIPESERDDLLEKIGRPFYEVTLHCTLDRETGEVVLVSAEL